VEERIDIDEDDYDYSEEGGRRDILQSIASGLAANKAGNHERAITLVRQAFNDFREWNYETDEDNDLLVAIYDAIEEMRRHASDLGQDEATLQYLDTGLRILADDYANLTGEGDLEAYLGHPQVEYFALRAEVRYKLGRFRESAHDANRFLIIKKCIRNPELMNNPDFVMGRLGSLDDDEQGQYTNNPIYDNYSDAPYGERECTIRMLAGWCAFQREWYKSAMMVASELVVSNDLPHAHLLISKCLLKMRSLDEALTEINAAIRLGIPDLKDAVDFRVLIYEQLAERDRMELKGMPTTII
jgi:tetratricopeptide (TPR) repeat protein